MIQLQILSGKMAGSDVAVRHFPFLVGRSPEAQLRLDDGGVWDRHLEIHFQQGEGFTFTTQSDALTLINAERASKGLLKNGDLIDLGSTRIRLWLARGRQKTQRGTEMSIWAALFGLFAAQGILIALMLR